MLVPSAALVLACLLVGVLPAATLGPYLMTAAVSLLGGRVPEYQLAVWHGLTVPLTMSLIALVGGLALYLALLARGHAMVDTPLLSRLDARRAFDVVNVVIVRGADKVAHAIFSSRLQVQLLLVVTSAWVAGMFALRASGWQRGAVPLTPLDPLFLLLWIAGAACALGAAQQAKFHRLAALIMLGGTGLVTCLTFAWFSAPISRSPRSRWRW
jgi:multicomponent K+:H+ antiporter subunit A